MGNKKVISVLLALALLVTSVLACTVTASAAASDTVKVWKLADRAPNNDRITLNADGSITSVQNINNHLVWGMNLGETGALAEGTYYIKYTFKVDGKDGVTNVEDPAQFGFWEGLAGKNARFGSGPNTFDKDGEEVTSIDDIEDGVWYTCVDMIEVTGIPATDELRFKNLWNGGDFYLSLGAQVVISKNDTPLVASAAATIATEGEDPTPTQGNNNTPAPTQNNNQGSDNNPKTGDVGSMLAIVTVAAAAFGGIQLKRRK